MKRILSLLFLLLLCFSAFGKVVDLGRMGYSIGGDDYVLYAKAENNNGNILLKMYVLNHTQGKELSLEITNQSEFDSFCNYLFALTEKAQELMGLVKQNDLPGLVKEVYVKAPYLNTTLISEDNVTPIVMNYSKPSMVTFYYEGGVARFDFYSKVKDAMLENRQKTMSYSIPVVKMLDFMKLWASKSVRDVLPE